MALPHAVRLKRLYSGAMDIEARIKQWAQAFPAAEVDGRIAELEATAERQREDLAKTEGEIERLKQLGQIRTRLAEPAPPSEPDTDTLLLALVTDAPISRPRHRRDAVLWVFDSDPSKVLHLDDIQAALVKRGWLSDSKNDRHALQMTLSNMVTKTHDLARPKMGYYRLATSDGGS